MNIVQNSQTNATKNLNKMDGLLFFGNRHETVPTRLLQDKYLNSRAKFAWQIINYNSKSFDGALFPSYEQLQLILSDKPYSNEKASKKTVSQTLLLLRLTRWLTLCDTVRDSKGRILGNIYIVHDEPIGIMDCIGFNESYLSLLEKSSQHKDKVIQNVAKCIIQDMLDSSQDHFVSHIDLMRSRYFAQKENLDISTNQNITQTIQKKLMNEQEKLLSSKKEPSETSQSFHTEPSKKPPSFHTELNDKSLILDLVSNGNSGTKYSTYINNSTVLEWPREFNFTSLEKNSILQMMRNKKLDYELCQAVLNEAGLRIQRGNIKNPLGYVYGLINRASAGQFKHYLVEQNNQRSILATHTTNQSAETTTTSNSSFSKNMMHNTHSIKQPPKRTAEELKRMSDKAKLLKKQLARG